MSHLNTIIVRFLHRLKIEYEAGRNSGKEGFQEDVLRRLLSKAWNIAEYKTFNERECEESEIELGDRILTAMGLPLNETDDLSFYKIFAVLFPEHSNIEQPTSATLSSINKSEILQGIDNLYDKLEDLKTIV